MALNLVKLEEAANLLGVSPDDLLQMRSRGEINGFRDGALWKFRKEDVDRLVAERAAGSEKPQRASFDSGELTELPIDAHDDDIVLLGDLDLGGPESGPSSTVIGGAKEASPEPSGVKPESSQVDAKVDLDARVAGFETLDLEEVADLEAASGSQLPLDAGSSSLSLAEEPAAAPQQGSAPAAGGAKVGDSTIDLAGGDLDDDDLVLGSGSGSDITISAADSGISLIDPADSGLSLEEPLALGGAGEESLELGGEDLVADSGEEAEFDAVTEVKPDDDFLLTPMEEATDEDSDSGSQVIALDAEGTFDDAAATMLSNQAPAVASMLEEDLGAAAPVVDTGLGVGPMGPLTAGVGPMSGGAPVSVPSSAREVPYTLGNVLALAGCALFLTLTGMMMYDLMRNMWSWDGAYAVNSSIMDFIAGKVGLFGK
ncbi:MAG: helix-turn-helix domain-containing protein [Pirellulales bacterium]